MKSEENLLDISEIEEMQEEVCQICNTPESKAKLFDAIDGNDILRVCEDCAKFEGIPIIKKPSAQQLKQAEEPYSVYERLSRFSGLPSKTAFRKDANVESLRYRKEKEDRLELFENFNWRVQRARRIKKISPQKLAELLSESEEAIKMIEKGELPENSEKLLKKLEQYFQISLIKQKPVQKIEADKVSFKSDNLRNLTIGDLRRVQKEREMKKPEENMSAEDVVLESEDFEENS
jgi:ribosome-binding protein aMBF1 (putative translation factor)